MGLFGKKEPCPICGAEVTGLIKTKIGGGKAICRSCSEIIIMQPELRKKADVDFIKEHIAYREKEAELVKTLHFDHEFNFDGSLKVKVDETLQMVAIDYSDWYTNGHPVVLRYSEIVGYELLRQGKKVDSDAKSGETFVNTMTSALGGALNTSASQNDFLDLKLKTTNKYWPEMNITLSIPTKMLYSGYDNNMVGIGNLFKCIVRHENFVLDKKY